MSAIVVDVEIETREERYARHRASRRKTELSHHPRAEHKRCDEDDRHPPRHRASDDHRDHDREREDDHPHGRDRHEHDRHDRDRHEYEGHDRDDDDHRRSCAPDDDDRRPNEAPSKIVERVWYFDDECDDDRGHGRGGKGGDGPGRGDPPKPRWPGRPVRPGGTSTGRLDNGKPLGLGDIHGKHPPGEWVGPRADLDLPYLFMRANAGDLGARPVSGAFWESPDIFVLAGVDPVNTPDKPPVFGQVADAGQPNTLYAHVWNFGNAAANQALVEFYWVNPALGINETTVNLIAQTMVSLGAKGSGHSHAVVKCPTAWIPTFINGGHECLLVRVWDNPADLPGEPLFDARWNRHVAQRNIHVEAPVAAMHMLRHLGGGAPSMPVAAGAALKKPILINVGPLYGAPATVAVERVAPHAVPWLQLHTGQRGVFPAMAPPTGAPALGPAAPPGGGIPTTGGGATQVVHHDNQVVALTTSDDAPGPGDAHVYRVTATQGGEVFGGYTVVVLG